MGDRKGDICRKILHKDFPEKVCYLSSASCAPRESWCSDFDDFIDEENRLEERDLCESFKYPDERRACLLDNNLLCVGLFTSCDGLSNTNCITRNILSDYKRECYWDGDTGSCKTRARTCDSALKNVKEEECDELQPSTSETENRKCIYENNQCEAKTSCENINDFTGLTTFAARKELCIINPPIIQKGSGTGYEYDYKHKCIFVQGDSSATPATQDRCVLDSELRTCEEYKGSDPSICLGLKVKDETNKRCVFKNGACSEEYKTCELYSSNELRKTKSVCEGIKLLEENSKCIFNIEEDKCETSQNYDTCDEYPGLSQVICESIKPSNHSRFVLDKDSKCKERTFFCSEVFDEENCLYYAKASINYKKCAYDPNYQSNNHSNICYEEYQRCEDYLEGSQETCEHIILYNGKKCVFDSNRCRTINKTCSDAGSEEECNLIAKSGVSNPDKKVCRYFSSSTPSCIETYKYCSDYRGGDSTFCESSIKPYNEAEDKIDITSKCVFLDSRCHKVPKQCHEADSNPVLCSLISPKIKDNNKMYCAFIDGACTLQFKKCEYFESLISSDSSSPFSTPPSDCDDVIPENYLDKPCALTSGKCVKRDICNVFSTSSNEKQHLCQSISHDCEYSGGVCTTKKEYSCEQITFSKDSGENEDICRNKEASVPYKICTLKEERDGCKEIINIEYTPLGNTSITEGNSNSAGFISYGIHLILILLSLLF